MWINAIVLLTFGAGASLSVAAADVSSPLFNAAWHDLQQLSDDAMQGRQTMKDGAERARVYLRQRFTQLQLDGAPYDSPFQFKNGFQTKQGINLVGIRRGCVNPDHFIIVTAHYDHLGIVQRKIYNGADDNASGVAGLLYLAAVTQQRCPPYSVLFVATDAEELGLFGAKAFVATPPVPASQWLLNINLDMISRGERGKKLVVAGTKNLPRFQALASLRESPVRLVLSHDYRQVTFGRQQVDWPNASDHAPFRKLGIPYLYFGVEVHPHYHTPDDDWQRIQPQFYQEALAWVEQSFWFAQGLSLEQWRDIKATP